MFVRTPLTTLHMYTVFVSTLRLSAQAHSDNPDDQESCMTGLVRGTFDTANYTPVPTSTQLEMVTSPDVDRE